MEGFRRGLGVCSGCDLAVKNTFVFVVGREGRYGIRERDGGFKGGRERGFGYP